MPYSPESLSKLKLPIIQFPSSLVPKDKSKIEVKEGDVFIKSQSVDKDYEIIKQKTEEYKGYIGN